MSKARPIAADEPGLWAERLKVLKVALDDRVPGSVRAVKEEIRVLNGEVTSLANRREMAAQTAKRMRRHAVRCDAVEKAILVRIEGLAARISDLGGLIKHLRRVELPNEGVETPEAKVRPARTDPILLLENAEKKEPGTGLTNDQARAAKEIARINEAVARVGQAKVAKMQGSAANGGSGFTEPELTAQVAEIHACRYLPWADWLNDHDPVTLDICIKVSVYGHSLKALARHKKMRRERVLDSLRKGLNRYWDERELLPIYTDKQRKAKAMRERGVCGA